MVALDAVDFDLRPGEVHVLFGENGAGKSTLISLVAGVYRPTAGRIEFRGREIDLAAVHQARQLGISAVFQEFSLVPQLTVGENLFLGAELTQNAMLSKREMKTKAKAILDRLGFPLNPDIRVAYLSRAEQQMVEIAKAFRSDLSVLILDEPTASLTERETAATVPAHRAGKGQRRGHHLHYPPHERDQADRRPHHRAAGWQVRRHARRCRGLGNPPCGTDDRAGDRANLPQDRLQAGRPGLGREESIDSDEDGQQRLAAGARGRSRRHRRACGLWQVRSGARLFRRRASGIGQRVLRGRRTRPAARRGRCWPTVSSMCRPTGVRKVWS